MKSSTLGSEHSELRVELESLAEAYLRALNTDLEKLVEMLLALASRPDALAANATKQHAHRIAGTAGCYGLWEVSRVCAELEVALQEQADSTSQAALGAAADEIRALLTSGLSGNV